MTGAVCLGCGSPEVETVLSMGKMPLANRFLTEEQLGEPEPRHPLDLAFCSSCSLAQITETVDPDLLFGEYAYFSSFSDTMLAHAEALATRLVGERRLSEASLVVEVASNDGYLLQHYAREGIPVLGIEPARNVARVAEERGIPTVTEFFGPDLARELTASGRVADVVHANNVLAHVPDVNGFLSALATILAPDGVAVVETPYVRELVDRLEFDTIYHEHVFYYSLRALDTLFRRNGLRIVDVERIPIHGGSLRVFATGAGSAEPSPAVEALLEEEDRVGLGRVEYFRGFAHAVEEVRRRLSEVIAELASEGRRLAAYGAAAKGTVLLNSLDLGPGALEFVADRSPHKQGRFIPGVHVPIVPPERILESMPDVVLLLAWNFADEILDQQAEYRRRGGRFLLPIPEPRMVR